MCLLSGMKQHITARVEPQVLKDAKQVAKDQNRSFNNFLETSLITATNKHHAKVIAGNDGR